MSYNNSYEIQKNDIFALTPFYRDMIVMDSDCIDEPIIPFKEYSVYVFNSLLEPILRKKFNFDSMVFRDIPFQGKMVSTIQLLDQNNNYIKLSSEEINWIQSHINNIVKHNSKFFNFYNFNDSHIFRPWVHVILPFIKLKRKDEDDIIDINSKIKNNFILLDLSEDLDYLNTSMNLYPEINNILESMFNNGLIPKSSNTTLLKNVDNFSYFYNGNLNGEESFEKLLSLQQEIDLPEIDIPSEKLICTSSSSDIFTVYKLFYSHVGTNPFNTYIGSALLYNLKKFLDADEIVTVDMKDHFEISLWKNNNLIESNININDLYGKLYFTDDIRGLLVLKKLNMMDKLTIIEDTVSKKKGLFLPLMIFGEVTVSTDFVQLLENYKMNIDIYDEYIDEIKEICISFQLEILDEIFFDEKEYIFVRKNNLISQRSVLRSLGLDYIEILIDGIWMDQNYSIEECDKIIKICYGKDFIRGPYKTYYLKFKNKEEISNFENKVYDYLENLKDKNSFLYG